MATESSRRNNEHQLQLIWVCQMLLLTPHIVANKYSTCSWLVEGRQNINVNWTLRSTHIPSHSVKSARAQIISLYNSVISCLYSWNLQSKKVRQNISTLWIIMTTRTQTDQTNKNATKFNSNGIDKSTNGLSFSPHNEHVTI